MLMKPLPPLAASGVYRDVLGKLGIDVETSPSDQLKSLIDLSPQKVLSSIDPGTPIFPVLDDTMITSASTYTDLKSEIVAENLPGSRWCKRVMFGDCKHDVSRGMWCANEQN